MAIHHSYRAMLIFGLLFGLSGCGGKPEPAPVVPAVDPTPKPPENPYADLIEQVKPLLAECRKLGAPGRVTMSGKAIILDLETGKPREAQKYLPEPLMGNLADPELTLFLIVDKHKTVIATYKPTEANSLLKEVSGYRVDLDLAIVRWPSKKPVGFVQLKGEDPPISVSVRQWVSQAATPSFLTGSIDSPLSKWVASRPVAGKPDPVGEVLASKINRSETIVVRGVDRPQSNTFTYEKDGSAPKRQGKVLVWDVSRDRPAGKANQSIPENLRGQNSDAELTIVMVTQTTITVTKAEGTGELKWGTAIIEGSIVHWPGKEKAVPFKLTCEQMLGYEAKGFFQEDGQVASELETGLHETAATKLARWIQSWQGQ